MCIYNENIERITIDLDSRDIEPLIHCLQVLKKYGFTRDLSVNVSPNKHGFHIIAWSDNGGVSFKKLLEIRREAGDDQMRIKLDNIGDRAIQVLFTYKEKKINKQPTSIS